MTAPCVTMPRQALIRGRPSPCACEQEARRRGGGGRAAAVWQTPAVGRLGGGAGGGGRRAAAGAAGAAAVAGAPRAAAAAGVAARLGVLTLPAAIQGQHSTRNHTTTRDSSPRPCVLSTQFSPPPRDPTLRARPTFSDSRPIFQPTFRPCSIIPVPPFTSHMHQALTPCAHTRLPACHPDGMLRVPPCSWLPLGPPSSSLAQPGLSSDRTPPVPFGGHHPHLPRAIPILLLLNSC